MAVIHVTAVKDQLPKEVDGATRHLVVKETEIRHITKNHLHFKDTEYPENELMFTITKPCFSSTNQRYTVPLYFVFNLFHPMFSVF